MTAFLAYVLHAFVPVVLIAAGSRAASGQAAPQLGIDNAGRALLIGGLAGGVLWVAAGRTGLVLPAEIAISVMAVLIAVLAFAALLVPRLAAARDGAVRRAAVCVLTAAAAAEGVFRYAVATANLSLSPTDVLNTTLVVNVAAIVLAAVLAVMLGMTAAWLLRERRRMALAVLGLALVVLVMRSTATAVLGLLRLDAVAATATNVSFVALAGAWTPYVTYVLAASVAVIGIVALSARAAEIGVPAEAGSAEQRKARRRMLSRRRWLGGAVGTAMVTVALLTYHDFWVARPLRRSPAQRLTAGSDGVIRIASASVGDGHLHRFDNVASDGRVIRFFCINGGTEGRNRVAVVFDACTICGGDSGYAEESDAVVCLACGVHLFIPSVGRPGGCNPIPIEHREESGDIAIDLDALDAGAPYFNEIIEIAATDPVTGTALTNRSAPFHYQHAGRWYYFDSESSYESFRQHPDRYLAPGAASSPVL